MSNIGVTEFHVDIAMPLNHIKFIYIFNINY